jgi:hypothetical protein
MVLRTSERADEMAHLAASAQRLANDVHVTWGFLALSSTECNRWRELHHAMFRRDVIADVRSAQARRLRHAFGLVQPLAKLRVGSRFPVRRDAKKAAPLIARPESEPGIHNAC